MMRSHPSAMTGIAKDEILNFPNHNKETYSELRVVPILAHMITPMALGNIMIPAPTKPKRRSDTKLLLCNIPVTKAPVQRDLRGHLVYFSR